MKRLLSILMIVMLLLTFVACDVELEPDKSDGDDNPSSSQTDDQGGSQADDQGQGSEDQGEGEGGGKTDPVPKATYTVTFIQEGEDPFVATYEEGDPLWLHAPDLGKHNIFNYYYNWDAELDTEVVSEMTVTRTENEGHAVFFMNADEHAVKIVGKAEWTTLPVAEFPAVPEIEGYTGFWEREEDIGYFSSARQDIVCWYYSTETFSSTGMPKSYILPNPHGKIAFAISEYPIHVAGNTLTYVNKENFASAASGLIPITSDEAYSVINATQGEMKETYAAYSFKEQTDYLIQNVSAVGFVNAINVMRLETEDDGWSVPQASNLKYVFLALAEQGKGETFYGYLSDGLENVRSINVEYFFLDSGSNRRMRYSSLESYGPISAEYSFGSAFTGYLWPIKPIEL